MIDKFINKLETEAKTKIFTTSDSTLVDSFINNIKSVGTFPDLFKEYIKKCSVNDFYEFESDKLLIRFKNSEDLINNEFNFLFIKNGFFVFADNSDCDIYLLDISKHSKGEVYLSSMDLLDNEEKIVFYKGGINEIPFNYENIKKCQSSYLMGSKIFCVM